MLSLFAICVALCWTFGVSECELGETEHTDAQGNTHCMKLLSTVLRSANPECSIEEQSLWINVAAQSNEIFYMNAAHWNVTDATVRNHLQVNDVTIDGSLTLSQTSQLNELQANDVTISNSFVIDQSQAQGTPNDVPFLMKNSNGHVVNRITMGTGFYSKTTSGFIAEDPATGSYSRYSYAPMIGGTAMFMGRLENDDSTFSTSGQNPIHSTAVVFSVPNYIDHAFDERLILGNAAKHRISIWALECVYSKGGFASASDRRIKKDVVPVPDTLALDLIRKLDSKYYKYIDHVQRGNNRTIGFIAQEVMDAIPEAVSLNQDFVPDEMRPVKASWNNNIMTLDETLEPGVYRFYVANTPTDDQRRVDELMKDWTTIDGKTFETDGKQFDNVFLYGRRINDFHVIDKQKIFAVAYSALQQVDKNQQALQNKVRSLEATVLELSSRLSNLENQ
jgi:hypothetical protein